MGDSGEIVTLLRALVEQQTRTNELLAALPGAIAAAAQRGTTLSRRDRECLVKLLPKVHSEMGDRNFTAAELIHEGDEPKQLNAALVASIGPLDAGAARRLGSLFKRAAGVAVGDLRIVRLGDIRNSALWKITLERAPVPLPRSSIQYCA